MRVAILVLCAVLLWTAAAWATTYLVRPDGTGDFPTIQAAINAAVNGDVIELSEGTFTGTGNRDIDYHGKPITVRSQTGNPGLCIIDCGGTPIDCHRGFVFQTAERDDSVLEGVTVTHGYWFDRGGAIFCGMIYQAGWCNPTIRDCVFIDNTAGSGGAISLLSSPPAISNCTFYRNHCDDLGGGAIWCDEGWNHWGSNPRITSCTFVGNHAPTGGAVWACGSNPTLEQCVIAFNTGGGSLTCGPYDPSSPVLTCCDLYGNAGGDWVGCIDSQYGIRGNISADPIFCNPDAEDFTLAADSPCAPGYNPDCGLIGAWPVGCEHPQSVQGVPTSSGSVIWSTPNPFVSGTTIACQLRSGGLAGASVEIYDVAGRLVRTLRAPSLPGERGQLMWDGTDDAGCVVPGGVYLLRLEAGGGPAPATKVILAR